MSLRGWMRRRRHLRRWKRAEKKEQGPLREFVYLDEVSVYSLVASQVGLVVTEVTETQASSLQSEFSSGIGVSAPLKGEVGSKIQTGESQSSQVLRKAIIQTTFKQLHDTARRTGALRLAADNDGDFAEVRTLEDVKALALARPRSPWVVPAGRLRRGDLVEMDVQLEAEPIFQAGMAVTGMLDIIQDDPAAFGMTDLSQFAQLRLMSQMLNKVLAGLVPVRGRSVRYQVVEIDHEEWLLHRDVVAGLHSAPSVKPAYLVGVAQQGHFWKDVRRVLFSGSEYRVLARLNRAGVQGTWTPVKLVDVLSTVVPDFANIMDTLNRGVLASMSSAVQGQRDTLASSRVRTGALTYAALLGDRAGVDIAEEDFDGAGLLNRNVDGDLGVREWRELLAPITRLIEQRLGREVSREVSADYRAAAIMQAGLVESSAPPPTLDSEPSGAEERFLDAEIVAVYW